ncbi:TetR family transcriptional regulator [Parvibaculum sedimenti]|uniref:TetR family transcriptional regulator n=2 Tax=Parvibaculum sedimenti TaxID=2608632 RepID=A0A6N6VHX4_9HYPH|nr:TetR/AcrR family transcriptional regulator [Parvibaculum sedimenti]KAB7739604.1 TetR family transcriptional regulator [Parvibaculum sedimenti]
MQELNEGRTAQKARTRAMLLQSASLLMQQGKRPTVEEAADAVGISKRTAYRYFTSQDHMLADAALESLRPVFARVLETSRELSAPSDRLEALIKALNRLAPTYENELRVIVRSALDRAPDDAKHVGRPRGQRRIDWVAEVLAPLKPELPEDLYDRLAAALAAMIGFDIWVWLRDVGELPPQRVDDVMVWMGRTLVDATLREADERGLKS